MLSISPDEWMSICIARQVRDGDIWTQGINTPLVMAGLTLAKLTHAPNMRFASAIGQSLTDMWSPVSLTYAEEHWLRGALMRSGFGVAVGELLPAYQPREFFRPAQIDAQGNFNNIAIGRDPQKPRLRLPGSGGIPDVSVQYEHLYLYVPHHARSIFTERVDVVSGLGHSPERRWGAGACYLVSDLGEFDWYDGQMRLVRYFPFTSPEQIQQKTGFRLLMAQEVQAVEAPSIEDLQALREQIDPLGIRKLETLSGAARKAHLRDILLKEQALRR